MPPAIKPKRECAVSNCEGIHYWVYIGGFRGRWQTQHQSDTNRFKSVQEHSWMSSMQQQNRIPTETPINVPLKRLPWYWLDYVGLLGLCLIEKLWMIPLLSQKPFVFRQNPRPANKGTNPIYITANARFEKYLRADTLLTGWELPHQEPYHHHNKWTTALNHILCNFGIWYWCNSPFCISNRWSRWSGVMLSNNPLPHRDERFWYHPTESCSLQARTSRNCQ